jgi:hypothetical protein
MGRRSATGLPSHLGNTDVRDVACLIIPYIRRILCATSIATLAREVAVLNSSRFLRRNGNRTGYRKATDDQ